MSKLTENQQREAAERDRRRADRQWQPLHAPIFGGLILVNQGGHVDSSDDSFTAQDYRTFHDGTDEKWIILKFAQTISSIAGFMAHKTNHEVQDSATAANISSQTAIQGVQEEIDLDTINFTNAQALDVKDIVSGGASINQTLNNISDGGEATAARGLYGEFLVTPATPDDGKTFHGLIIKHEVAPADGEGLLVIGAVPALAIAGYVATVLPQ